jgi:hypothetical protein
MWGERSEIVQEDYSICFFLLGEPQTPEPSCCRAVLEFMFVRNFAVVTGLVLAT